VKIIAIAKRHWARVGGAVAWKTSYDRETDERKQPATSAAVL
jgi:hypothetical protein